MKVKLCCHCDITTSARITVVRTLTTEAYARVHAQNGKLPYIRFHASSIQLNKMADDVSVRASARKTIFVLFSL